MSKFCVWCGNPMLSGARFCGECGGEARVPEPPVVPANESTDGIFERHTGPDGNSETLHRLEASVVWDPPPPLPIQKTSTKKWPIVAVCAVVAIVIGWIVASPYIAVYQLQQAAKTNDIDTIKERVDFVAVRESLKDIAKDEIAKDPDFRQDDNPFMMFGALLVTGVADQMIDTVVTPQNFARLMRGEQMNVGGIKPTDDGHDKNTESPHQVSTSMNYESFSRFIVHPTGSNLDLVLTRSGITSWKLTAVRLAAQQNQASQRPIASSKTIRARGEKYLAVINNQNEGIPQFLKLPEVKSGLDKLFKNHPPFKVRTECDDQTSTDTDGNCYGLDDPRLDFEYGLYLPDGDAKIIDSSLVLSGCTPHACPDAKSFLSLDLPTKAIQAAELTYESSLEGNDKTILRSRPKILLYGVPNLESASTAMQKWVNAQIRESEKPDEPFAAVGGLEIKEPAKIEVEN